MAFERDCLAMGSMFQLVINDMKAGSQNWEDLVIKATKFHAQLKGTITASTAFLDSFQKIADMATSTRGGTKEIGSALTRICLRHRSVEAKLKTLTSALMDCLVSPLQDRLEEWKKTTVLLDKDHGKEIKRLRQELKKRHPLDSSISGTLKMHRKLGGSSLSTGGSSLSGIFSKSMESVEGNEKLFLLEETEKKALRRALIEERSRFCLFVNFLRPVVDEELAMLHEVSHLQEVMDHLCQLTADPYILPPSSEAVIADLKMSSREKTQSQLNLKNSPPSSPSSFSSRKSSMCSISSFNSNSISNSSDGSHSPQIRRHHRKNHSISMFDSRNIESLVTYHPSSHDRDSLPPPSIPPPRCPVIPVQLPSLPPRNTAMTCSTIGLSSDLSNVSNAPLSKESVIYASSGNLSLAGSRSGSRPPPPPPARRTSSISDPDAITLGTLASTGCSTYEEVRTLRRSGPSDASLYASFQAYCDPQPIYSNLSSATVTASSTATSSPVKTPSMIDSFSQAVSAIAQSTNLKIDYDEPSPSNTLEMPTKSTTTSSSSTTSTIEDNHLSSSGTESVRDDALPPPPPEAFMPASDSTVKSSPVIARATFNRITSVRKEFLESLNEKLAVHQQERMSPRLVKRRSMSVGEQDWDSDSGITNVSSTTGSSGSATSSINSATSAAQTLSLQQSLMRLMGHNATTSQGARPTSAASICARITQRLTQGSPSSSRKNSYTTSTLASVDNADIGSNTYQGSGQASSNGSRSGSWPSTEAEATACEQKTN